MLKRGQKLLLHYWSQHRACCSCYCCESFLIPDAHDDDYDADDDGDSVVVDACAADWMMNAGLIALQNC